jgi:hypothetical protein
MRTAKLTSFFALVVLWAAPYSVPAEESPTARIQACERVMTRFVKDQQAKQKNENDKNKKADVLDPNLLAGVTEQCHENSQSLDYWRCVEDTLDQGETPSYAANACPQLKP